MKKQVLFLIIILSVLLFALGIKNQALDTTEPNRDNINLYLIYGENGVTIKIKVDQKDNKNICFYFDNETDNDLCCFVFAEYKDECILQSSLMEIPAFCENHSVELFGAWRDNNIYVNGIVLHIKLLDSTSFKEIYRETFELL